eukprot:5901116-Pleurochrysis_carterae.AAC.3
MKLKTEYKMLQLSLVDSHHIPCLRDRQDHPRSSGKLHGYYGHGVKPRAFELSSRFHERLVSA